MKAAAAIAFSLVLAGCGGGSSDADEDDFRRSGVPGAAYVVAPEPAASEPEGRKGINPPNCKARPEVCR